MALNFILDAVIILILVIGIILGIKRGFVETVAKPVRIIASFGVAFGLCRPVGEEYLQPLFEKPLVEKIVAFLEEKCSGLTAESASEEIPGILKLVAKIFGIDIGDVAQEATASVIDSIAHALSEPIAHLGAVVLSFIGLFLVTNLVCFILLKVIDLILNFGPLEVVNKIFGCIVGAIFSFLLVWVLTVGFDYVTTLDMFKENETIQNFAGGPIYQFVHKINPIDLLFKF